MKQKQVIRTVIAIFIIMAVTGKTPVHTKDQKAEEILNSFVSAAGGRSAHDKIQNIVSTSELIFLESGITINRSITETRSNEYYIQITSSRLGEITRGYDGSDYWEKRQNKIRLIDDAEKTSILNSTAFLRFAEWQKYLTSYSYGGTVKTAEQELHKLDVVTIYGSKETWYFNKSTFLLTQIEEPLEMPEEISTVVTLFEDYREVNGIMISFSQTIQMPGQTRRILFSEILTNQAVDASIFKMPEL
jgi:zinc protease